MTECLLFAGLCRGSLPPVSQETITFLILSVYGRPRAACLFHRGAPGQAFLGSESNNSLATSPPRIVQEEQVIGQTQVHLQPSETTRGLAKSSLSKESPRPCHQLSKKQWPTRLTGPLPSPTLVVCGSSGLALVPLAPHVSSSLFTQ